MTAAQLKARIDRGDKLLILDVRQESERKRAHIQGSQFIPLDRLSERCHELDKSSEIVVYCHLGGRSARATAFLVQNGYKAVNLEGGITAWIDCGHHAPALSSSEARACADDSGQGVSSAPPGE